MIVTLLITLICYIIAKSVVNSNKTKAGLVAPTGNILIFDTETNGLPRNWKASLSDTDNWPRIISIAWNKIAPNGQLLSSNYAVIKPNGFSIDSASTTIHGISNEYAMQVGLSIKDVLLLFENELSDCHYLVAHNIDFDYAIAFAEFTRVEISTTTLSSISKICTMKKSVDYCKIPTTKGYKYPKLNELYQKLFGISISNEHNAKTDADACMKCFKELYNQKVITF